MAKIEGVQIHAFVLKFVMSLLVMAFCLAPSWVYLLARFALAPDGFWQNLILFGLGVWLLGAVQVLFFVGGVVLVVFIWLVPVVNDDKD